MRRSLMVSILAASAAAGSFPGISTAAEDGKRSLAMLDGAWSVTVTCNSQTATLPPMIVDDGRSQGRWGVGQVAFSYDVGVSPGGAISGSASGPNVHGRISGNVTDWRHGTAAGTFDVHGRAPGQTAPGREMACAGTWQAQKTN